MLVQQNADHGLVSASQDIFVSPSQDTLTADSQHRPVPGMDSQDNVASSSHEHNPTSSQTKDVSEQEGLAKPED